MGKSKGKKSKRGKNPGMSEPVKGPTENGETVEESIKVLNNKAEAGEGPEAQSKELGNVKETSKKRKRSKNKHKKSQPLSTPESSTKEKEKTGFAGFIFMCSTKTKKDCFKYGVFGVPMERKDEVKELRKGMKLFLFDIDRRLLYGIYVACCDGGIDLEPEAFKEAKRKFPAQVRFRIHKDCMPLEEVDFKQAIKENYSRGKNWFDCKLSGEQVGKLMQLFRPLDSNGLPKSKSKPKAKSELARDARRKPREDDLGYRYNQAPIPLSGYISQVPPQSGREAVYLGGHQSVYGREHPLYGRDHLETQLRPPSSSVPLSHVTLAEAEALYQQKLHEAQWDALRRAYGSELHGANLTGAYARLEPQTYSGYGGARLL